MKDPLLTWLRVFAFLFLFEALFPATPEILSLSADFSTSTLLLKWNDGGSALPHPSNATWEIKVLQNTSAEPIKLVSWDKNTFPRDTKETTQLLKLFRQHPWVQRWLKKYIVYLSGFFKKLLVGWQDSSGVKHEPYKSDCWSLIPGTYSGKRIEFWKLFSDFHMYTVANACPHLHIHTDNNKKNQ